MERINEIATLVYEIAKDYKEYFCVIKSEEELKRKKRKIEEYLIGFYNSQQLYGFVKKDKQTSIKSIIDFMNNDFGIMRLYNIIESNIQTVEILSEIDTVYKFLYDVMSLEECCEVAYKKYGNEYGEKFGKEYNNKYKKYCDLYIKMQKAEKDLLDYLKETQKEN